MADGNDQVAAIFAGGWVVDKERVGMVVVEVGKREMGGRYRFAGNRERERGGELGAKRGVGED